jgi:hypothetical protein
MSLQFIRDVGVYVPDKDAVKFTAVDGRLAILCYARRSSLIALGCEPMDDADKLCTVFERQRAVFERTATQIYKTRCAADIVIQLRDLREMQAGDCLGGEAPLSEPSARRTRSMPASK